MKKKNLLFAAFLALGSLGGVNAQTPDPIMALEFTTPESIGVPSWGLAGCVVNTAYTTNSEKTHTIYSRKTENTNSIADDEMPDRYLGVTDNDYRGFWYTTYNANDALGQAFANKFTLETVVRMDKNEANNWNSTDKDNRNKSTGTAHLISSELNGGWSIYSYPGSGLSFTYWTSANGGKAVSNTADTHVYLKNGQFYHLALAVDNDAKTATFYVNGKAVMTQSFEGDFVYPQIGDKPGSEKMWFCIGSAPVAGATKIISGKSPDYGRSSCRCTYSYVKFYDEALTADQIKAIYDTDLVQHYTQVKDLPNDVMFDIQFKANGDATDASAFAGTVVKRGHGAASIAYNHDRYEATFARPSDQKDHYNCATDFYYVKTADNPSFNAKMDDEFSFEVYCQSTTAIPPYTSCPMSYQQGGGIGFEFTNKGQFKGNINTYGYPLDASVSGTGCRGSQHNVATADSLTTTEPTHYIIVFKRGEKGVKGYSRLYINGTRYEATGSDSVSINEHIAFPFAPFQYLTVGADPSSNYTAKQPYNLSTTKADCPFDGVVSIARVWSKALTAEDAALLSKQAEDPAANTPITITSIGYASACLPYTAVVPEGVTAYVAVSQDANTITLQEYATAGEAIPYATPVILKGAAGTYHLAAVASDASNVLAAPTANLLQGTLASKTVTEDYAYVLAELKGAAKMALTAANLTIPANRAFILNSGSNTTSKSFVISDPTGIKNPTRFANEQQTYYDLNGRKVAQPTRGIYIQNGKKVFVK